jgi:integrase
MGWHDGETSQVARTIHRLTAVAVTNARAKGLYPDGGGLYLRVTSTGTKSWILRFKRCGRTRDMGLGPLGLISLARARELAAEAGRQRLQGQDPIKARDAQRAAVKRDEASAPTFKDCAEQYISSHEAGWRNAAKHAKLWRHTLRDYAYPIIGDVPVAEIDTNLIMQVLNPIWENKPETASRVRSRMEAVLDGAKVRGLRDGENPARWRGHLAKLLPARSKVRRVRHHPALPYVEIPAFMEALRARNGISARTLEFVILTAARSGEVRGACWDEIDLGARMWIIPVQRMKGGKEHRVPLSDRALAILKEMQDLRQNDLIFPGSKQGQPLSDMSLLMLLRELRPGITTHGFRSTFKDWAAEYTNIPNFVSEAALAHVVADKVEAAYRRTDLLEKRRKLMDTWDWHCTHPASDGAVRERRRDLGVRTPGSGASMATTRTRNPTPLGGRNPLHNGDF